MVSFIFINKEINSTEGIHLGGQLYDNAQSHQRKRKGGHGAIDREGPLLLAGACEGGTKFIVNERLGPQLNCTERGRTITFIRERVLRNPCKKLEESWDGEGRRGGGVRSQKEQRIHRIDWEMRTEGGQVRVQGKKIQREGKCASGKTD